MSEPDRRITLKLAAASALSLALPHDPSRAQSHALSIGTWSQRRWRTDPFALGVASGSPTHDSLVLWTRLLAAELSDHAKAEEAVPVGWELSDDDKFTRIQARGQSLALPSLAYSVHVEVSGLQSDRWYFYRFISGQAISPIGRTRTFPAPDTQAASLRLAYASCQRWEHGFFSAWRHMKEENLDAVLFLGDYIYEYPGAVNAVRHVPGGWVQSLDDYRARHALYKSDPDLQAMHASCPWLLTWDDHEVQNDYAGSKEGSLMPLPHTAESFAKQRAVAYQAYYEHMPLRASVLTQAIGGLARGAEMRLYSHCQFGRLAGINLLDTRQYRDRQACTRGSLPGASTVDPSKCASWQDPARSLLGANQERWLGQVLGRSNSVWNVLGQQTLFGSRNLHTAAEPFFWNDGWDGYPAARSRLIQTLQTSAATNPVVLGGDAHENWVGHILAGDDRASRAAVGVEFCGTSISSRAGGHANTQKQLAENPHFVFADAKHRGYGVAHFTPKALATTLRVVSDVTQKNAGIDTLAKFVVTAGHPVIERA
jgi:alkaline phosphatase D